MRVSARQGTYVAPARQTVAQFLHDDWLPAVRRTLAESTWESYERNIRHHVVEYIGHLSLQAVDGAVLNRLYATLLESGRKHGTQSPGLKPRTVRYVHTIIHAALDDAVRWHRVPSMRPIKPRRHRPRRHGHPRCRCGRVPSWRASSAVPKAIGTTGHGCSWRPPGAVAARPSGFGGKTSTSPAGWPPSARN